MAKVVKYMNALRPWSFSASLTPVLLGSVLAYSELIAQDRAFSFSIFILTLVSALCVHGAGNLVNTYYDYKNGIDKEDTVSDRILVDKTLSVNEITMFGVALYVVGSVAFLFTLLITPAKEEQLAFIYFGGLSLSFLYTGGIGFKYLALGDLIIMITFGPITVLFSYLSQIGYLSNQTSHHYVYRLCMKPLLLAIPLALNTEAILHSNNTRDLEQDKRSGIVTLAIYLGRTGSYVLYVILLFLPYFLFLAACLKCSYYFGLPILTIVKALSLEKDARFDKLKNLPVKTAQLNLTFGCLYVVACFLSKI